MSRFARERIAKDWFDTIVDSGEDGRGLPERLRFFADPKCGTSHTNMDLHGMLTGGQTAVFYGGTLLLMAESFDPKLGHLLQQCSITLMLGEKGLTFPLRAASAPVEGVNAQQAAYGATFGVDRTRGQEAEAAAKPTDQKTSLAEMHDLTFAPELAVRQGFTVRLEVPDGFRQAWLDAKGPKALRMILHSVTTRDLQ